MPKFMIETTYELPVYRQHAYEAETVEQAMSLACEDADHNDFKPDFDTSGPIYVSGAWEGEKAYSGDSLPIPAEYDYSNNNRAGAAIPAGDPWTDDPDFPSADWMGEVANGDTRRGYLDWVRAKRDEANGTPCPDCGGAGAFPKTGMDCGRCYGGGTITPETEAAWAACDAEDATAALEDNNGPEIFEGWFGKDALTAQAEGWDVFDANGTLEIERDDEAGVFASDEEAIAHVRERAATGSDLHVRALKLHEGE